MVSTSKLLLSQNEAAAYLGISSDTVKVFREVGLFTVRKSPHGRQLYYSRLELEQFVKEILMAENFPYNVKNSKQRRVLIKHFVNPEVVRMQLAKGVAYESAV